MHDFDNYKSALSEGEALAVVVQAVPGNRIWTWVCTDSPSPQGSSAVRRRVGGAHKARPYHTEFIAGGSRLVTAVAE